MKLEYTRAEFGRRVIRVTLEQALQQGAQTPDFRLETARSLLAMGWPEGRARALAQHKRIFEAVASQMDDVTVRHEVSGFEPDISRYLQGEPACMFEAALSSEDVCINLLVNVSFSAAIDQEKIFGRGAALLALVDALESKGKRVKIDTVCAWSTHETYVSIKDHGERLDVDRMAFILAHEAYLRGVLFSFWKSFHETEDYGSQRPTDVTPPAQTIYPEKMLSSDKQWDTVESSTAWVLAELVKQGVKVEERFA